jgi:heme a synthase
MNASYTDNPWLCRFAWLTAFATLVLIVIGGLVTSHGAGMAVPDWPNSYGYNMFLFPVSKWVGGILYEHSHRLVATFVGLLTVILTRWLGGSASRVPLAVIGVAEIIVGEGVLRFAPDWSNAGHFLAGIGGVVLLAGVVWVRNGPATKPLPWLGWIAFVAVQVQGLLGGLRVVLFKDEIGIFHATLAQLFFVLLCVIAFFTTKTWQHFRFSSAEAHPDLAPAFESRGIPALSGATFVNSRVFSNLVVAVSILVFLQLILGATMRHQHAGLAIPDFPLAYGKLWPATDPGSVELYNSHRLEVESYKSITAFQIELQMVHRLIAAAILIAVAFIAFVALKSNAPQFKLIRRFAVCWLALVLTQACLGAATIWSKKAADVATAHVLVGALLLATGGIMSIVTLCSHLFAASLRPTLTRPFPETLPTGLAPSSGK